MLTGSLVWDQIYELTFSSYGCLSDNYNRATNSQSKRMGNTTTFPNSNGLPLASGFQGDFIYAQPIDITFHPVRLWQTYPWQTSCDIDNDSSGESSLCSWHECNTISQVCPLKNSKQHHLQTHFCLPPSTSLCLALCVSSLGLHKD